MIIPLVSYPYLIRVLEAESYGLVIYITTIVSYFSILINFGYQLTATKKISQNRHRPEKLNEIFSAVVICKLLLFLFSAVIFVGLVSVFDVLSKNLILAILCFIVCLNDVIFPGWFFQGVENMKYITIINVLSRFISLALVFIFISRPEDYLLVPVFNFLGAFGGAIVGWYHVKNRYSVKFSSVPFFKVRHYLQDSLPVFATNVTAVIKDRSNILFIGGLLGTQQVAYYYLANRVISTVLALFFNISASVFPNVAKSKDYSILRKTIYYTFLLGVSCSLGMVFLSKFIVQLYGGEQMLPAIPILQILSLTLVFSPVISLVGLPLIVNNKYGVYYRSATITTLFYLVSNGLLFWFDVASIYTITYALIVTLVIELVNRAYLVKRAGLGHWIFPGTIKNE
jgi:PST family polysaccharide transporter